MTVFQYENESLVVDCGVLFPSDHTPGVDLILPDLDMLQRAECLPKWIVLTHGHEDHIGAVPFLVRRVPDIVLVGTRLTLALIRAKLTEHGLNPTMIEIEDHEEIVLGPFAVQCFPVAHSVPGGIGLVINTPTVRILHTGDFKIDPTNLDGRNTDLNQFRKAGDVGVDVLLSDSTNAQVPGTLRGEGDLGQRLNAEFSQTKGKVIFACFASNIHRVQQAVNAAVACGRQVCFTGRSMIRNMGIAQELGYLSIPDEAEISFDDTQNVPPSELAIICTGSQGEPLSALARMSRGQHKVHVGRDDKVILSARFIPGNETDIFRVVNGLSERGAKVLTPENAPIHASGHAGQESLAKVIELVRPRYLVPVHGEWRHLQGHAELARNAGMDDEQILLIPNGSVIDFVQGVALVVGSFGHTNIYVDGTTVGHVGRTVLRDRSRMSESGLLQVVGVINPTTRELAAPSVVNLRGVPKATNLEEEAIRIVQAEVSQGVTLGRSTGDISEQVRRQIQKLMKNAYGLQPLVIVNFIEIDPTGPQ